MGAQAAYPEHAASLLIQVYSIAVLHEIAHSTLQQGAGQSQISNITNMLLLVSMHK